VKIAIGADHAGFQLKKRLVERLQSQHHAVVDVGASSDKAVDYPHFARGVAEAVADGRCDRGIMIDGAGIGSSMVANKIPGIRAALAYDLTSARNSREHNDANVLTLGAGLIGPRLADQIVDLWLEVPCTEQRHLRRVAQIEHPESGILRSTVPSIAPTSASSGLMGAQPARSDVHATRTDSLEITEEDLERIAREIQRLLPEGCPSGPHVADSPETARRFLDLGARRFGAGPAPGRIPEDIARYIDHTLLRADATEEQVRTLCAEASEHGFATVCINPIWVPLVTRELRGTAVKVCSVAGFPLGATAPENKALEARRAIREGAEEIDMVISVGALKGGDDAAVLKDIRAVVEACRDGSAICKVIIEAALLTDEEKRRACRLARRARAHFVKTSTGFGPGGATAQDVALMAEEVAEAGMEVKAAGGIRSYADAKRMIEAGASRIGASAGVAIAQEAQEKTVSA
jgi:deoxyribose-phosphate aldolase